MGVSESSLDVGVEEEISFLELVDTPLQQFATGVEESLFTKLHDEIMLAWVAAFFDAEGCVHLTTDGRIQLWVTNTNLDAIKFIQQIAGGSIQVRNGKNKKVYRLYLTCSKAIDFLKKILPYSIVKREAIFHAIKYYENNCKDKVDEYRRLINSRLRGD